MYFSDAAIENLANSYNDMHERAEALVLSFASYNFTSARAREFATHGFSRRLAMLVHCIEGVFATLEPESEAIPSTDTCNEATVFIQAFMFNVFGALDNLAWIWVEEKQIKSKDGNQFREDRVGLGKKHKEIRRTFSTEFREYLNQNTAWFKHLADFRHALAHRIPLYIPRYAIVDQEAYDRVQRAKDAVQASPEEFDRLTTEQLTHTQFLPVMTHSISEKSPKVVFHPQILSDFAMVEEIGKRMLRELDRQLPSQNTFKPSFANQLWKCLKSAFSRIRG